MIVGMMWNKDEADILEETIESALPHVDSLFIADDGSRDKSWDIIQSVKKRYNKIEHIQQKPDRSDKGQRQSLLNQIRKRYRPEDTWVQVVESDIMIAPFVDLRKTIETHAVNDVAMYWKTWNCIRDVGTWYEVDTYPNWKAPIAELMYRAHRLEDMLYTFRPVGELIYDSGKAWRPWPSGFASRLRGTIKADKYLPEPPVLLHYGYRGPTHFYQKYKNMGKTHRKYKNWKLDSVRNVELTVSYFNGEWNGKGFIQTREGFRNRHKERHRLPKLTESRYK